MDSPRPDKGQRPAPRLYLITPALADAAGFAGSLNEVLAKVLPAADIAAMLLRLADADERSLIKRTKSLAAAVQPHGIALLLDGRADIVARGGADGVHLSGIGALNAAIGDLKPNRIAGAGGLKTRDDAMLAGEAGADYVMFGEPDEAGHRPSFHAVVERVGWWAELFQPPCVGFAGTPDEVGPLAEAGADFVALGDWIWASEERAVATVRRAAADLLAAEPVQ